MRERPLSRALIVVTAFVIVALAAALLVVAMAEQGRTADTPSRPAQDTTAQGQDAPLPPPLRVEVLNGAGKPGLARQATQHLRGEGFDVVFFGNASRFDHERSVVLDRSGRRQAALAVAATLGIDSVDAALDASLFLDVSVVLGSDWPPAPAEEETGFDRFRRFFTPGDPDT